MNSCVTGTVIKRLRERMGLTQAQLAERLQVSDKTVSKWETGRGLPDISMIGPIAGALGISVIELMNGETVANTNRAGNMRKSKLYVCPVCGNVICASGEAVISCCGVSLPAAEDGGEEEADRLKAVYEDGEYYVTVDHEMTKTHYISFIAYITDGRREIVKLYPEGSAEARFSARGCGRVYAFCNRHGLMGIDVPRMRK